MSEETANTPPAHLSKVPEKERLFSKADLKKLILPLMVEQTLALTVGMIDTIMVASTGESAVSGVSLVDTINILIINLFSALATGGAIIAAQYLGRKDHQNASHGARQLILSTFILSFIVMVFCLVFNQQILLFIFKQSEVSVMSNARTYFYVTAVSFPFIALYNAAAALFRGMGNSRIAMVNAFIMNLVNIVGNAIFIFGFDMGVFGAGLATLLSRVIAALAMLAMLRDPALPLYVRKYSLRGFDLTMVKRIMRIGIPNGLENSMFQIGKIIVAGLVVKIGTTAIAANAVSNSLAMIEIIPGMAMGLALTTVISQCVGAGEYDQAQDYLKRLIKVAFICMLVLNVAMTAALRPILSAYKLSEETLSFATQILMIHGVSAIFIWPISFSLPNAFRAAGDVKYPLVISILSMWIFRIGLSYLLVHYTDLGVVSVWIAMIADWTFRSICFAYRWWSGKWKKAAMV